MDSFSIWPARNVTSRSNGVMASPVKRSRYVPACSPGKFS
jgi:hypothetical protein